MRWVFLIHFTDDRHTEKESNLPTAIQLVNYELEFKPSLCLESGCCITPHAQFQKAAWAPTLASFSSLFKCFLMGKGSCSPTLTRALPQHSLLVLMFTILQSTEIFRLDE